MSAVKQRVAKAATPATGAVTGRFEPHRIDELVVLGHIQRKPAETRIRALAKDGWAYDKMGIFLVAKIVDGVHKGVLHVYDGGTRHGVAEYLELFDMVVPCWVQDMTEAQAAKAFDAFNSESKKPTPLEHYRVGIQYGHQEWTAVKNAFDALHLRADMKSQYWTSDEDGTEFGVVAAMTACKNVITNAVKECATAKRNSVVAEDVDPYVYAAERLEEVLAFTRQVYTTAEAHDSDLIQAIARLRALHGVPFVGKVRKSFSTFLAKKTATQWRDEGLAEKGAAGSESRGTAIATYIGMEYNAWAPKGAALRAVGVAGAASAAKSANGDEDNAAA